MAQLEVLATMGEDALQNHYSIILPTSITQLAGITDQLTLRINSVNVPDKEINEYDITKRGRTFGRPSGKNEQSKEVSFNFRPDKKFLTYKAISNWMNFIQNNNTMFMASDSGVDGMGGASQFRATLEVWAIDNLDDMNYAGVPNTIWTFVGAYPKSLGGLEFNEDSGDPFDVDVTLSCMDIIYPYA